MRKHLRSIIQERKLLAGVGVALALGAPPAKGNTLGPAAETGKHVAGVYHSIKKSKARRLDFCKGDDCKKALSGKAAIKTESDDESLGGHFKNMISSFREMRRADKRLKAHEDAVKTSGAKWSIRSDREKLHADIHKAQTIHLHHAKQFGDKLFGRNKK